MSGHWLAVLAATLPPLAAIATPAETGTVTASTAARTATAALSSRVETEAHAPSLLGIEPELAIEYRVQALSLTPLSLNDTSAPKVGYFDQRARLRLGAKIGEHVKVILLADLLDGVLFGDNGSFTGSPKRNRGSVVATRSPNLATIGVGQTDSTRSSLDRESYGLILEDAPAVVLREVYGEALLPFGLVRAGRQPLATGRMTLVNEGTRINRWGVSHGVDTVDALAFGTKLSAVVDAITGEPIDTRRDRGLFAGVLGGQLVEGHPQRADDLFQWAGTVFHLARDFELLGAEIQRLRSAFVASYRHGDQFDTSLLALNGIVELEAGPWRVAVHHTQMIGATREVSEGLKGLGVAAGAPASQPIRAFGGFVELAYRLFSPLELSFELYYASGDDDPRSSSSIGQFTFSENTNVGLHLFENILAYETARSARMGVANLNALNPSTYPAAEIDTHGGLQNAVVLFPQVLFTPIEWLDLRAGVMFAFAQKRVVDPISTLLRSDGTEIEDDLVNFNGGPPGTYWGTEVDLGLSVRPVAGFQIDLEGAYLVPGDGLEDENGEAVSSTFGALRLTYANDVL